MLTSTGSRRDSALNSLWLSTSSQRSIPAARAISTLCSITLVDPPIAIVTVSALRSDAGVTMSRGRMPGVGHRDQAVDQLVGKLRRRRGSSDGGATMCSGSMPSTPMKVCIVL